MQLLTITTLKLLFASIIFIIILIAGWYPFKQKCKNNKHYDFAIGESLATGVFLGAALMHMLPDAHQLFLTQGYQYPFAFIITGAVFLFFLWFEHLATEFYQCHGQASFAIIAWIMLSIHSLMAGAALGLSQQNTMIFMLFFAIIIHKWAESFSIALQLNKSHLSTRHTFILFLIFATMSPVGIFLGWYCGYNLSLTSIYNPILISTSAGTFLYLGTLHGLEKCVMVQRCCNLSNFSFVIIGFLLMGFAAIYN